jgi:hypothetical protein
MFSAMPKDMLCPKICCYGSTAVNFITPERAPFPEETMRCTYRRAYEPKEMMACLRNLRIIFAYRLEHYGIESLESFVAEHPFFSPILDMVVRYRQQEEEEEAEP